MIRIISAVATSLAVCAAGFAIVRAEPQSDSAKLIQSEIAILQEKRIELLEQRVTKIKHLVEQGRIGAAELIRPEMDVINARLDYVDSIAARKKLLGDLLAKYDMLIEIAEFSVTQPVRPGAGSSTNSMMVEPNLLQLKSERIRIQILHETLD